MNKERVLTRIAAVNLPTVALQNRNGRATVPDASVNYQRHVALDQVVLEPDSSARDKYEAIAHSVRDLISPRWLKTEEAYKRSNAKRVYYLSMEFLLGRALANNVTNLLLDPDAVQFSQQHDIDPPEILDAIGDGWIADLMELENLKPLAHDSSFRQAVSNAKHDAKARFLNWLNMPGIDPDTIFDTQIKRIHEYKRQLLNALHLVVLYNRLLNDPKLDAPPRTFFFAGKAAPAYHFAKLVIKFINNLATTLDHDPIAKGRLKILFVPDALLNHGDYYRHLADLSGYAEAHQRLGELYRDPKAWGVKTILNIAASGQFSSDCSIAAYARDIWNVNSCPFKS